MDDVYTYIENNEPRFVPEILPQYIDLQSTEGMFRLFLWFPGRKSDNLFKYQLIKKTILILENRLGSGRYGHVFKAEVKFADVLLTVAVKAANGIYEIFATLKL